MNRLLLLCVVGAVLNCLILSAEAVILPPTDDTSGTLTYNTAKPPVVTKRSLTSLNGTGTTLPVSKTRTAFVRFEVEGTGMTAGTVEKARLTLYFPSVTKVGDLSLHVVTQDWEETFVGPTRIHPTFGASFLTIPVASVVKKQFIIVDVTQQVKDWLGNPGSNFGIAVTSPDGIGNVTMGSKEGSASGYPALLEIESSAVALVAAAAPPPGMVLIPAGAFTMGDSLDGLSDAAPTVSTTVSGFYMDVNEVTLSQWQSVYYWARDNGYTDLPAGSGKGPNHPVQTVSWYACVKWCNARSEREGKTPVYYTDDAQTTIYKTGNVNVTNDQVKWSASGYRLPTEAEWEKAARGGRSGQRFPWGNTITQNLANYNGATASFVYDLGPNGYNAIGSVGGTLPATSPVGSFAANGYGLNDMAGNIFEWCWDWYGTPYAGSTDPKGAASGIDRVLRGGGWVFDADYARCAQRANSDPDFAIASIGFRAVLPPGQ